jgi:hypothetical protein
MLKAMTPRATSVKSLRERSICPSMRWAVWGPKEGKSSQDVAGNGRKPDEPQEASRGGAAEQHDGQHEDGVFEEGCREARYGGHGLSWLDPASA